jgi:hypothetical protein
VVKKYVVCGVVGLLASNMLGINAVTYLRGCGWFDSVSVTSTNVTLKFKESTSVTIWDEKTGLYNSSGSYIQKNATFVLTPDCQKTFAESPYLTIGRIYFTPVFFKTQQRGFRVSNMHFEEMTNHVAYLVLNEKPIKVGEKDVLKVMENGKWKTLSTPDKTKLPLPVMSGMDAVAYLQSFGWFDSVSVTSANLALTFKEDRSVNIDIIGNKKSRFRRSKDHTKEKEALVLTPDNLIMFAESYAHNSTKFFMPISLKNQQTGFRVSELSIKSVTNYSAYFVLSDTPVQVDENDVEMIMENRKWITYVKKQPEGSKAKQASPNREGNEKERLGETPSPLRLWLYIGISLCVLVPILYFLRRKFTNH